MILQPLLKRESTTHDEWEALLTVLNFFEQTEQNLIVAHCARRDGKEEGKGHGYG